MEVRTLGAHATGVQREERTHHVGALLGVVARNHHHGRGHLETIGLSGLTGLGEALVQTLAVEAVLLRCEEQWQPTVADLGRQSDVLRTLGREEDGDVAAQRVHRGLQRLAEPGAVGARVRQVVERAVLLDRLLARQHLSHDVDVLARAGQGLAVGLAVPALHHLRTAGAEAQDETSVGEMVEGDGGHRRGRRRAGAHLHDGGAQSDVGGVGTPPRQRSERVAAVRLGRPDGVEAQAIGLLHRFEGSGRRTRRPVAGVVAEFHRFVRAHDLTLCGVGHRPLVQELEPVNEFTAWANTSV